MPAWQGRPRSPRPRLCPFPDAATHCRAKLIQAIQSREWEQAGRGSRPGDEGKQSGFPSYLRGKATGQPAREDRDAEAARTRVVVATENCACCEQVGKRGYALLVQRMQAVVGVQAASQLSGRVQVLQMPQARARSPYRLAVMKNTQSQERFGSDSPAFEPAANMVP